MTEDMTEETVNSPVHLLRPVLYVQTRLLDTLIHRLSDADEPLQPGWDADVVHVTLLMIQALGVSVHSILRLTSARDMAIRDGYGIARSVSELAVNICYIAASGGEVARRADRHALQKTYRDLHRTGAVGGISFELRRSHKPEVSQVPGLAEALTEFTGRKGQEIIDWTPLNISARIEEVRKIHSSAALALSGSTISVYRHSSELLHGTYFSVLHFWSGSGQPATTRSAFDERWTEHFITIFSAVFFATQGVLELFGKMFGMPELSEAQKRLNAIVKEKIERAEESL